MLTTQQLTTLKAAILAETDKAFVPISTANDEQGMADWYNGASPTIVWRTSITKDEIYANGFNWVAIDDVAEPKWRVWIEMFDNAQGATKPDKANVRAGIAEVWKGNATKLAVQTYVLDKCKRAATRAEALFASGTGTSGSPSVMGFEGTISAQRVSDALRA